MRSRYPHPDRFVQLEFDRVAARLDRVESAVRQMNVNPSAMMALQGHGSPGEAVVALNASSQEPPSYAWRPFVVRSTESPTDSDLSSYSPGTLWARFTA